MKMAQTEKICWAINKKVWPAYRAAHHAEGTETWEGLVYCRWPLAQKKHIYKYK